LPGFPTESDPGSVLVIAGFDPSGCAGVMADLRALEAVHALGAAVVTAVTYQNPWEFDGYDVLPKAWLDAQFDCLGRCLKPDVVKVGMLGDAATADWTVTKVSKESAKVVIDPVMTATRGGGLVDSEGVEALRSRLMPCAFAVTPNIHEAEILGLVDGLGDVEGMKAAAGKIHELGVENVIITGGHLVGECHDLWFDGSRFTLFRSSRLEVRQARGLGTLFNAALSGHLAGGAAMEDALVRAKQLVHDSLRERDPRSTGPLIPARGPSGEAVEVLRNI
jgi:hydroxymethylpyrimidine/phosphomethylpyrimidine kinase